METKRSYEDLSRRALISLNHDYDADNDNHLQGYLDEKDPEKHYEGIRTVESITVKVDNITDAVRNNGGALKKIAVKTVENALDKTALIVTKLIEKGV